MRRAIWRRGGRRVAGSATAAGLTLVVALAVTVGVAGLSGCTGFFVNPNTGGGGGGATGSNIVYVANGAAQTISGWVIGTGTLTAVSGLPGPLGFVPTAMAVSRANTFMWISDGTTISSYVIGSNGVLNSPTQAALNGEVAMDVSPDGQWLVGLDALTQTLDVFAIDGSTGALTLHSTSVYPASVTPKMVRFAPSGGYVYLALGTTGTVEFGFDTSAGAASAQSVPIPPGSATTSDNAVVVNAASSIVYVARSGTNQVLAYGIGNSGVLTPVAGSPFAAGGAPYDLAIVDSATGASNLYVANRSDGTVGGYAIGTTGALTAVLGSPYAGGSLPQSLVVDSTGTYLFAAGNGGAPDLTMYSFNAGALAVVTTEMPAANDGSLLVAATH